MTVTIHVKCFGLHSEDLCCNTVPMASHVSSTVTALSPARIPLKIHPNQAVFLSLHDGVTRDVRYLIKPNKLLVDFKVCVNPAETVVSCSWFDMSVHTSAMMENAFDDCSFLAMGLQNAQ